MTAQKGFTLIELLVSISIIGLVFSVIISAASNSKPTARDAQRQADLKTIQGVLQRYYSDQVYYPKTSDVVSGNPLTNGGSITYIKEIPQDPSGGNYKYEAFPSGCDNTVGNTCKSYCLGATLEQTTGTSDCDFSSATDNSTYNLRVGSPQ